MSNLYIWDKAKSVPDNAQKPISGGRLSGMTDINPMWRLKTLTEMFGPCGIGWKYEITDKRLEAGAGGEIAAFVDINLYYLDPECGEWSGGIPGTGGASFVAKERNGLYVSDECFKMALTDAISVACKALGFGADVYWNTNSSKYNSGQQKQAKSSSFQNGNSRKADKCSKCGADMTAAAVTFSTKKFGKALCPACQKEQA